MKFKLFSQVALRKDIPELNLIKGSIGTIVERYLASDKQKNGYSLEGLISQNTVEVSEAQIKAIAAPIPPVHTVR